MLKIYWEETGLEEDIVLKLEEETPMTFTVDYISMLVENADDLEAIIMQVKEHIKKIGL